MRVGGWKKGDIEMILKDCSEIFMSYGAYLEVAFEADREAEIF